MRLNTTGHLGSPKERRLGRYKHEHQRDDRSGHMTIRCRWLPRRWLPSEASASDRRARWDNIKTYARGNFDMVDENTATQGSPYDYGSPLAWGGKH